MGALGGWNHGALTFLHAVGAEALAAYVFKSVRQTLGVRVLQIGCRVLGKLNMHTNTELYSIKRKFDM